MGVAPPPQLGALVASGQHLNRVRGQEMDSEVRGQGKVCRGHGAESTKPEAGNSCLGTAAGAWLALEGKAQGNSEKWWGRGSVRMQVPSSPG